LEENICVSHIQNPSQLNAGKKMRKLRLLTNHKWSFKSRISQLTISIMLMVFILINCMKTTDVGAQQIVTPSPNQVSAAAKKVLIPLMFNPGNSSSSSGKDWPMVAANPQRTSWTPEEVRGDLSVDWYRPIEPYIPYKIQPIAANGKIYVSSAKGLYTFQASNGAISWVYPTELPLGNSPTIATVNGISTAFVGGYDKKIHAINAISGQDITGYIPFEAMAGFESNPLVVNNTIYAGNRDGYFYAVNAVTGALKWSFKTDGPILYSAAYKNGTLYFASNDAHAYALNETNGSLVWKSAKFPGEGFHSFWPVVYTDKTSGKDYVIFDSGENLSQFAMNLALSESTTLFSSIPPGSLIGPSSTTPGNWAPGTVVMDATVIATYLQNRPDRRTVFVLDRLSGAEYTYDSNGDGKPEYAPFSWSGVTQSGSKYPPIVNGIDGVYYQDTAYYSTDWVSRGGPVGWKFGTQYISRIDGRVDGHASDEPMAFSSGGKIVYWVLCCDRESGGMDITIPYGQPNRSWNYSGYDLAGNYLAPGYQQMYNSGNATAYNNMDGWQVYSGKNMSVNGVYGKHGTTQSPPIPYQGKLYYLKGNALLAFSPTGTSPKTPLPLATTVSVQTSPTPPTKAVLSSKLEAEVLKMIAAGPLRPGYAPSGFVDLFGDGWYDDAGELGEVFDYFQNPADTVYTLLLSFPYLSSATQQQVKNYLINYYGPGAKYDITKIVHIGWGSGAAREVFDTPIELAGIWGQNYRSPSNPATQPTCGTCGYWKNFPPFSFYGAWKYAQIVGNNAPAFAKNIFDQMSNKLEAPPGDSILIDKPYWLNQYIAGYMGFLELQKLAGYSQNQNTITTYQHLLDLRVSKFSKDTPYPPKGAGLDNSYDNVLAVARNFMFMTPELADYLNQHILAKVQTAIDEYNYVAPYWFVSQFDDSYGEGTFQPLYDSPALFQAKAWILKQPYSELAKYLDVPAFYQGDLFYIQNLVAILQSN
jgi:outer membrane protein assembly factor BamB